MIKTKKNKKVCTAKDWEKANNAWSTYVKRYCKEDKKKDS